MEKRFDRLGMFRLIADKIGRNPALLKIGLENIDRWIANGSTQQYRLEEWRQRIHSAQLSESGLDELLEILREDSEAAELLRDFSPFDGILTTAERLPLLLECSYVH